MTFSRKGSPKEEVYVHVKENSVGAYLIFPLLPNILGCLIQSWYNYQGNPSNYTCCLICKARSVKLFVCLAVIKTERIHTRMVLVLMVVS